MAHSDKSAPLVEVVRQSSAIIFLVLLPTFLTAQQYGWRVLSAPEAGVQFHAIDFVDSLNGWFGTGATAIWKTTDGGYTWASYGGSPMGIEDISFSDSLNGWIVGEQGTLAGKIIHTTDGGKTWIEQFMINNRRYLGVSAQNRLRASATGSAPVTSIPDSSTVVQTTDSGSRWVEQALADSITSLGKIQFIDSTHGWMTGVYRNTADQSEHGGLLRTVDGGSSWQLITQPVGPFSFVDTVNGFAYGGRNTAHENNGISVLWTRDGGQTWASAFVLDSSVQGDEVSISAVSFIDTLNGWMFGDTFYQGDTREIIIRTSDGGITWIRESVGLSAIIGDGIMIDKHHGWAVSFNGEVLGYELITSVIEHLPELPTGFVLKQNYPNPFNNSTVIEYEIPKESDVRIAVYDGIGKLITTLVDQIQPAGVYRIQFDAKSLSSDIYYYTMIAGLYRNTKQLILLK